jgi:hypothetical protein
MESFQWLAFFQYRLQSFRREFDELSWSLRITPAWSRLISDKGSREPSAGSKLSCMTMESRGRNRRTHTNVISLIRSLPIEQAGEALEKEGAMDTASNLVATLKTFRTSDDAIRYLSHEGFTFMGAPGRWLHIEDRRPVYARIVPTKGRFQVRMVRPKRQQS